MNALKKHPESQVDSGLASKPRVSYSIGQVAGQFVLALVLFGFGGALWGLLRPSVQGIVEEGGTFNLTSGDEAEFAGLGSFTLATAAIAVAFVLIAGLTAKRLISLSHMLWIVFCTGAGSLCFLFVGDLVGRWKVPTPNVEALQIGSTITYLPSFHSPVALCAGMYAALFSYWLLAGFVTDADPSQATSEAYRENELLEKQP